jgi:signal transduction histidine kinase
MRLNPTTWLPKSLFGRMTLILVLGLLAAQIAMLMLNLQERAGLMAAGLAHPGMMGAGGLPLRFLWHLALTLTVVIGVALIAVRWVTRPLQQMAVAANAFAHDLDAAALDVTGPAEVRRAAEAFNFMQARLRQLVVERGRALAAVSHDLRTPLTRMRLRTELIADPALADKLNADIDTMRSMVDGVLAYLRGLEDAEPLQSINMEALLHSIVDDERSLGRRVEVLERAHGGAAPAPYAGKLSILRRAIANLLDNAVAHGATVTVRLEDSPAELRIVIEDDGPGIPEADLARVTEPFVRLDPSRSLESGGVGLGLAIVRDAAAYHGGRLLLENREAGGLRASLVLPRSPVSRT